MGILKIKELMQHGKYNQTLEIIEELGEEDKLEGMILKSRILERMGEAKKALEVAEQTIKESQTKGMKLQELKALISLGYCYLSLRNLVELTMVIQKGEQLLLDIKQVPQTDKRECQGSLAYLQGYLHLYTGETQQSLILLDKSLVIRQALDDQHDIVETLIAIGWVHSEVTGKLKLAFDFFKRSLTISEKLGNKTAIAYSLNRLGTYYKSDSNLDKALSYFEKSLALYQEVDNREWIAGLNNNIAITYMYKEMYDLALNYFEKALEIKKQLDDENSVALIFANIGLSHSLKCEFDTALNYYQQSLDIYKEIGNLFRIPMCLMSIGDVHYLGTGDLNLAFDYYNECLELCKQYNNDTGIAWSFQRQSVVYTLQGELDLALETISQSLDIFTKQNVKIGISICHGQLGVIYKLLGKLDQSLKFLEEGMASLKKAVIGGRGVVSFWFSYFLFHVILVAQDLNAVKIAEEYLKQAQDVQQETESKFVKLITRFSEAIVLKMSKRGVKKLQAQQIFQAIIEDEIIDHSITILAMLNLCELLILELQISETPEELLAEVIRLSGDLYNIAQSQKSPLLTVMSLILQTKLMLVKGKIEEANDLLITAKRIAEEKKLISLLSKVKLEQETVQAELDKWDELIQRKASIQERVERARIASYIADAKKIQEAWVRPTADMINQ
ncbi:MAG: tetratricopeptide repeat protein [Candidatus Heimdallarchaeota archaeon]|nr:MAG: tetratricopeptide repeat protein [Candidatus Heimdallarchaeota archaeon]